MAKSIKDHPSPAMSFIHHFIRNLILGFIVLVIILLIGIFGLHHYEKLSWLDCYTNAAMIVSGVGTLGEPKTEAGKLFLGTYSIFGGASFLLVIAVVFAPIFHWLFRQVKVEDRDHFKD